jgi:hypothetical protein
MRATTLFRVGGISMMLGGLLGPLGHLVLHPPSHALQYQGTSQWVAGGALGHSQLKLEAAVSTVFSINSIVFAWLGLGLLKGMRVASVVPVIRAQPMGGN